jgi:N-methylhydantoinase A
VSAGTRQVFDTTTGTFAQAAVVDRDALSLGHRVIGPAVVVESQTTTYVPPDLEAVVQLDGCLLVRQKGKP